MVSVVTGEMTLVSLALSHSAVAFAHSSSSLFSCAHFFFFSFRSFLSFSTCISNSSLALKLFLADLERVAAGLGYMVFAAFVIVIGESAE